ncbi:MAG: 16S rRNA (adenine(1518)-N(6)/adenine(1519)-N(6))-dimethyltransferase RsmA [Alphaproteobacteria bacterium]
MINTSSPISQKIEDLPPLKFLLEEAGIITKKSLGQNFLFDLNLTKKIVRLAGDLKGRTVIEIGAGPGGLTRAILMAFFDQGGAGQVLAIEKDTRVLGLLATLQNLSEDKMSVLNDDALKVNYENLGAAPRKIIANLPYNVSLKLLTNWLKEVHLFESMTLMFQKEVALRLTGKPNGKNYGRISVLAQALCNVTCLFDVPAQAFFPPPKVTSTIVQLIPKEQEKALNIDVLGQITAAAFGQRRKMLRQSLKSLNTDIASLLDAVGLLETQRAEDVSVAQYIQLSEIYAARLAAV